MNKRMTALAVTAAMAAGWAIAAEAPQIPEERVNLLVKQFEQQQQQAQTQPGMPAPDQAELRK